MTHQVLWTPDIRRKKTTLAVQQTSECPCLFYIGGNCFQSQKQLGAENVQGRDWFIVVVVVFLHGSRTFQGRMLDSLNKENNDDNDNKRNRADSTMLDLFDIYYTANLFITITTFEPSMFFVVV